MAAARSPQLGITASPGGPYNGVGTLLRHWGNSETTTVDEKQMKICEDSGLDSLLHLARMPHVKVQGLAMSVINSLREGENGDIHIESEEGFRPLVDLAKFSEEDVQREAVWSLAILASNSSCQARIEQEVGWHNFRKYAASTVPEIQAGTAILLGNLALEKRNQENLMVKGVPLLLTMLAETKDAKVRRAVVTALSNVSIIENYGAKDVWLEKGIELMMPFVEQIEDMQLQIGALNTLANVCNHDKSTELKRKVAQLGGIARLVPLLGSRDEMVVKLAAMTIANMASEENHRQIMHSLKIQESLLRLLDSRDEEVQLGVAMAINALADHEPARKDLRERHANEPLKELIQVSRDRDILKEAKEALRKISPEDFNVLKLSLTASMSGSSYTNSGSEDSESYTHSSSYDSEDDDDRSRSRSGSVGSESLSSSSESESDSDSQSDVVLPQKKGSSFLMRQQQEAKRVEEERKFREEQERRRIQEEEEEQQHKNEEAKKAEAPEDLEVNRTDTIAVRGKEHSVRKSIIMAQQEGEGEVVRVQRTEGTRKSFLESEETRAKRMEGGRKKEQDDEVPKTEEEIKKRAEEKRLARLEGKRANLEDGSSSHSSGSSSSSSSSTDDSEGEGEEKSGGNKENEDGKHANGKKPITEEERKRREEDLRRRKEEDDAEAEKRAEEVRKRREELDRKRRAEEEEFQRKEEVEKLNREELENSDTSSIASRSSRRHSRSKGSRRGSRSSIMNSASIPKNPAKVLVMLLKDAKHKKMVERDALRELERYANRRERDQLQYGEDIIAILVYVIYFYPDTEYTDIVILALYVLALLARYHVRNQLAIRRARGGDQIITLLQSGVEGVRRNAALALGAYTLNNKNIQGEVSRAIPVLSRILEAQQTPPATRRTVGACLAAVADNHPPNQAQVITTGGLRAAINFIPNDKEFLRSGLHLVAATVSHNAANQNQVLLDHPRFLSDLLGMINDPETTQYQDSIINTIVELAKKNPRVQQSIFHAEGMNQLVPLLEGYQNEEDIKKMQLVVNVLYLLLTQTKLTKYSKKVREDLVRLKVVPTIQPMCAAKSRLLAETALNLTKVIEARV